MFPFPHWCFHPTNLPDASFPSLWCDPGFKLARIELALQLQSSGTLKLACFWVVAPFARGASLQRGRRCRLPPSRLAAGRPSAGHSRRSKMRVGGLRRCDASLSRTASTLRGHPPAPLRHTQTRIEFSAWTGEGWAVANEAHTLGYDVGEPIVSRSQCLGRVRACLYCGGIERL